ncbi:MAG: hypothetical protein ACRENI_07325 [Gemmatimonadaceae bacterium]
MRTIRCQVAGLALLALVPAIATAQEGRFFRDSWFWGAKAGTAVVGTSTDNGAAPLVGAEWLITRTRGGLYIGYDHTFLGAWSNDDFTSSVPDPVEGEQVVRLGDLRRLSALAVGFPAEFGFIRPYFGIGISLNFIRQVTPVTGYSSGSQQAAVEEIIDEQQTRAAATFMVGAQAQLLRFSVFGQASYMPAESDFLLNRRSTYFFEAGIRYNVGTSIDRPQ